MEGVRRIARAYYERASVDERNQVKDLFRKLDANGDGKISLVEFKKCVSSWLSHDRVFKKLDSNNDGSLGFSDALALYYMEKKVIKIFKCDGGCRELLFGPYFSCYQCLCNKFPQTFDLCPDFYRAGKFKHEHHLSSLLDDHSLLVMFISQGTTNELKTQAKGEMEELREIARCHYRAGSKEIQALANEFFKSMDSDGDGRVDLPEFLAFMRQEGYTQMRNRHFFKELDRDRNGSLDFWEVMTLYYIIKSGRPFCDWCGDFIPGLFFSCVECFKLGPESSFNLCRNCYRSTKCNHNHNGRADQFLDNYTLLEARRDSAPGVIFQNQVMR
ncbi:hypothetical protein DH2020_019776 [Rehmannia glutinosa]|uniref:EF-hand domain-containing protein n=1 Tax=Rehmannia glutinosa TaxID=99300 RepID=A0ABR0WE74_REHGL